MIVCLGAIRVSDDVVLIVACAGVIILLGFVGGMISLIMLFPPFRRLGQQNTIARVAETLIVGAMALTISVILFTRLGAEIAYIFSTIGPLPGYEVEDPLKLAVVNEIWIRNMVPPSLQRSCYTRDLVVCHRVDLIEGNSREDWSGYLMGVALCSVSPLTGGSLVWVFTGRRRR